MNKLKFLPVLFCGALAAHGFAEDLYLSPAGADTGTCKSKVAACKTITYAVGQAKAADIIKLQIGTYKHTVNCQNYIDKPITLEGGFDADFTKTSRKAEQTVVTAEDDASACRVLAINSGHSQLTELKHLTVTGVNNAGSHSGAILTYDIGARLRLTNVHITNNVMDGAFGGIAMTVPGDELEIVDSVIKGNSAGAKGGGVYLASDVTAIISNSKINNNTTGSDGGGAIYVSESSSLTLQKNQIFANEVTDANGGAIFLEGGVKSLTIKDSAFKNNLANVTGSNKSNGGAIYAGFNDTLTNITIANTMFEANQASYTGGAIAFKGNSTAKMVAVVDGATFIGNISQFGAGLQSWTYSSNGYNQLTVKNSTFYNNTASGYGGALGITYGANADLQYNTFYSNSSGGGSIRLSDGNGIVHLMGNLVLESGATETIKTNTAVSLYDDGYNIIGFGGNKNSSISSPTYTEAATSSTFAGSASELIETTLKSNGGTVKTFALKANAPIIDAIPNDAIPYYGVGTSLNNPFTSLVQAHGALKSFTNYQAGVYYFDLEGSYGDAASGYYFTPSDEPDAVFTTEVDSDGWVLIASSDVTRTNLAAYAETSDLLFTTDNILKREILANASFNFEEVRVATASQEIADPVDIRTKNQNVITAIKNFKMLPNNYAGDATYGQGGWLALAGAQHINTGVTCANNSGAVVDLNRSLYHACGADHGIFWMPGLHGETQDWNLGNNKYGDDMNLWVRSSSAFCNGAITTTDGRGLPRADYKNPNDSSQDGEVHHCDIGAFEFNNGYRYDCYGEDGQRPENYVDIDSGAFSGSASHQGCLGGNVFDATPKALLDSYGSIHYYFLFLLTGLLFRRR